jgi:hypothetical protein
MHLFFDVYILFRIDQKTLWRWCRRAHIIPHVDPLDQRKRYLTDAQLVKLARLHHRVILADPDTALLSEIESLEARFEARLAEIEAKLRHDEG